MQPGADIIVKAQFKLELKKEAIENQRKILDYRLETQPYKAKTAGCCFRNPTGMSAGQLIEECGLKGMKIGGAVVSRVHANFIENDAGASAEDVIELIEYVQKRVLEKTGVKLELEVHYVSV